MSIDYDTTLTFRDLDLAPALQEALTLAGYERPTAIQAETIPHLLAGRDLLGQAKTGTGKTAAFALPLLSRLDLADLRPQTLVLAPTRELALQVAAAFHKYARCLPKFRVLAVYGGQDFGPQLNQLRRGVHVIVGTPGRVMDHMRRGTLNLDNLQTLVLDEADEMLQMGFAEDVEWILTQTPPTRQIALFSATLPAPIRRIAQTHLREPVEITISTPTATVDTIRQRVLVSQRFQKVDDLDRILEAEPTDGVIVFVKTKAMTVELAEELARRGHAVAALNGDMAQGLRERTIEQLKSGKLNVLVATDVAARGLDVQRISHVINFDPPHNSEIYIHRIGRTGRAGRSGESILFIDPRARGLLRTIERATGQRIEPMELPTADVINQQRIARFKQRIDEAKQLPDITLFQDLITSYGEETGTPLETIAAALARLVQGNVPLLAEDAPRHDAHRNRGRDRVEGGGHPEGADRPRRSPRNQEAMERFRVEVGREHGVLPKNIVGAIANEIGLDSANIGQIKIFDRHSTVDLPEGMPRDMFRHLQRVRVAGQPLNISRIARPAAEHAAAPDLRHERAPRPKFKPHAKAKHIVAGKPNGKKAGKKKRDRTLTNS